MTPGTPALCGLLSLALLAAGCGTSDEPKGGSSAGSGSSAGASAAGTASVGGSSSSGGAGGGSAGVANGGSSAGVSSSGAGNVAGSGGGDGGATSGDTDPTIPALPAACPTIATGQIEVLGQQVSIVTGPAGSKGPLVFYWHGTGGNPEEALSGFGAGLKEIQESGGVVASFSTSTGVGQETGNMVWHVGDFMMTDIIYACAVEQGLVDARRVYTAGCSAGGLQASAMVYSRSSYLAGAMPNSGGIYSEWQLQNPAFVPAVITTHGGPQDFVKISFAESTARFDEDIAELGGFVVNCNHGGDHCASPDDVKLAQWQFLKAHPFGVSPEPYTSGLPQSFPSECEIIE